MANTQSFIPNGGATSTNIYLPDQRKLISNANQFPYNTIVDIQGIFPNTKVGWIAQGTGVIIAPNVILTAGHVIYDKGQGGYLSKVQIYQANTNGTKGATSIASVTGLIPNGDWVSKDNASPNNYPLGADDLGLIVINNNKGLNTGWMGMTSNLSLNQAISLAGFPVDHRDQMWGMSGNVSQISNPLFSYSNISMYPGQSGSPVFNTGNNIVGINVAEASYLNPNPNGDNNKVPSSLASQYPNYGVQLTASNIN
ncbi:trypsin-like serine peptidase [Lactococcus cremoris]|uniref:trypsin-like serine peptidase n=1 Tax=Lactococcus lactis subsp. cremoris TaxID=1359 RepID=UPI00218232FC|nr:trypsin-like peptidase domain-containing protein [Lactococcus cremoris]